MARPDTEAAAPPGDEPPTATLLRLATAYQASRALHVAARLGLADLLTGGPRTAEDLASATGTHAPSLRRLLRALAAFGVFREAAPEEGGRFALTPLGGHLAADAPGSARAMVLMWGHEDYRRTWDALEHCVRTGETAALHLFGATDWMGRYERDPELLAAYSAGMTAMAATAAEAVAAAYDFGGARHVVDVGGGQGRLLATILRAHPGLRGTLLDRPEVVESAGALLAEAKVAERCERVGGDMFAAVPEGGDLYVLSRVIHDWGDAESVALLARCRRAMAEGGRLLLVERVPPERAPPSAAVQGHVLSDLNMLVRTGGRERTEAEYRTLLAAAGLRLTRIIPTRAPWSVVEGMPA
jgi:SAM-dependent methyltransferase